MLGWELPPHNSGGLGVACLHLTKYLAKSGADIEFVLPHKADYGIDYMRITGTDQSPIEYIQKAYNSTVYANDSDDSYINKVMEIVEERSFDIIHAHDWLTFRAALRVKENTGWPLIAHVHSIESDRAGGSGNQLVSEIEQTTFLLADQIIAVSQHTKDKIINDYSIPGDKISVIHNSLELEDIKKTDTANAFYYLSFLKDQGYRIVSNVGRQTMQKGLPNLVKAAGHVIKKTPKTIFLLVGDGEQQNELIDLAADLGISQNVIFAGFQRGKKLRDAFAVADLFVMPSISEPFGLTPLEAIGYGTPTLISKQSGVSEILRHSLKVDFWDVDEMANQILAALNSQALREELLVNAQKEISSLSWGTSAEKFIKVYNHVSQVAV